jgi:hypothetical protein
MSRHGYDTGRLNLHFVSIATFARSPDVGDWDRIEADVAVLGVEVAPDYDHTGTTAILAAHILLNTIGRIVHAR